MDDSKILKRREDTQKRDSTLTDTTQKVKSFTPPPSGIDPIPVQKSSNPIQLMQELPVEDRPDYFKPNYIQQLQTLPEEQMPERFQPDVIQKMQRGKVEGNGEVIQKKDDNTEKNEPQKETFSSVRFEGNKKVTFITERETLKSINEHNEDEIKIAVKLTINKVEDIPPFDINLHAKRVDKTTPPVKAIKPNNVVKETKKEKPVEKSKELSPDELKKMAERYLQLGLKELRGEELTANEKVELGLYKRYHQLKKINLSKSDFTTNKETLKSIFPEAKDEVLDKVIPEFNKYLSEYGINSNQRFALFLSQVGHESLGFQKTSVTESTYYKTKSRLLEIFPKYFTGKSGKDPDDYIKSSEKLANLVYANRLGNGAESSGEGYKYRGRGLMQLTGKDNYQAFTDFYNKTYNANEDFVANPGKIADNVELSVLSALWYFQSRVINSKSYKLDKIKHEFNIDKEDLKGVTVLVNGGLNGYSDRKKILSRTKKVLEI